MRREYTLAELAEAVGMTERNVRAYRSRGLIRPPRLRGRIGYYGFDHLAQLRLVQALTGRGLSLNVVAQLVERGVASTELARLVRDDLPAGPAVPLSRAMVEHLETRQPGLMQELADHGVGRRTAAGFEADPALLSLANDLVTHGVEGVAVSRICLAAAQAAATVHEHVETSLGGHRRAGEGAAPEAASSSDPSVTAVELATSAFRLALGTRLSAPGR